MDIVPKLQLNYSPKDMDNNSIAIATNIMLDKTESIITNEPSVELANNNTLNSMMDMFIHSYDNAPKNPIGNKPLYKVHKCFGSDYGFNVIISLNTDIYDPNTEQEQINRFKNKGLLCTYDKNVSADFDINIVIGYKYLNFINGEYIPDANYVSDVKVIYDNINNSRCYIINYENKDIRIFTWHNGIWSSVNNSTLVPSVRLPYIIDYQYTTGKAYKGWYTLFVRFKITPYNYTQWYEFGKNIYVDSITRTNIIKYGYNTKFNIDTSGNNKAFSIVSKANKHYGYYTGCSDSFSNETDIADNTFSARIKFYNYYNVSTAELSFLEYSAVQIGIICSSKSYTKGFVTNDIDFKIIKDNNRIYNFIFDRDNLSENSVEDFIVNYANPIGAKSIAVTDNRLYIANYNEKNIDAVQTPTVNLKLSKVYNNISLTDNIKRDNNIINGEIALESSVNNSYPDYGYGINLKDYFGLEKDVSITLEHNSGEAYTNDLVNSTPVKTLTFTALASKFKIVPKRQQRGTTYNYVFPGMACIEYDDITNEYNIVDAYGIVTVHINGIRYSINLDKLAVNYPLQYLAHDDNFDFRKITDCLIPNSIYAFYIHYVDEKGNATNGKRVNIPCDWTTEDSTEPIVPISIKIRQEMNSITSFYIYAAMPFDSNFLNGKEINTTNIKFYRNYDANTNAYKLTNRVTNTTEISYYIKRINAIYKGFCNNNFSATKWYEMIDGVGLGGFIPFINSNGDKLYRVPLCDTLNSKDNLYTGNIQLYTINGELTIPNGYVGAYFSYEKFNPIRKYTGILCRADAMKSNKRGNPEHYPANDIKSDSLYFFSDSLDINDSIDLDFNAVRIDAKNCFNKDEFYDLDYLQIMNSYNYPIDLNKAQIRYDSSATDNIAPFINDMNAAARLWFVAEDVQLCPANSAKHNRIGKGTCIKLKDVDNIIPYNSTEDDNYIYKVSLYKITRDLYTDNTKTLIRCSQIINGVFKNEQTPVNVGQNDFSLNGRVSIAGVLVYHNAGVKFNTTNNTLTMLKSNTPFQKKEMSHTKDGFIPFVNYVQYYLIDDHFHESKSFKNSPNGILYYIDSTGGNSDPAKDTNIFASGCMVIPQDSIDLFENRIGNYDNIAPKTYTNSKGEGITEFKNTIRRSALYDDESREIKLRKFPIEAYKNITNEKGAITNILSIGTLFIVHTERSMFVMDVDNYLKTGDKNVQLGQEDIFEVDYKEVFTSDKGYGGLQDSEAWTVGEFGYLWFDKYSRHIYLFDNNQAAAIDDDIRVLMTKLHKIVKVRFANDIDNDRIFIKVYYNNKGSNLEKHFTLTYNIKVKNFISTHTYSFDEMFNDNTSIYFRKGLNFYKFSNDGKYGNLIDVNTSSITLIFNSEYETIKYLDSISYKLHKKSISINSLLSNTTPETIYKYSGNKITIFNKEGVYNNTGQIDVTTKEFEVNKIADYNKPYYNDGEWNLNYIRDQIIRQSHDNNPMKFNHKRISGNYFYVQFVFNSDDEKLIELQYVKYNISKD